MSHRILLFTQAMEVTLTFIWRLMRSVGIRFKSAVQINQEELLTVPVSKCIIVRI